MSFAPVQLDELRAYCSELQAVSEGNITYIVLKDMKLPTGCEPSICDGLLCSFARDGYPCRLFFSEQIKSSYARNWTGSIFRIADRNWVAFSWKVEKSNPTLLEIVLSHFAGFTRAQ